MNCRNSSIGSRRLDKKVARIEELEAELATLKLLLASESPQ